MVENLAEYEQRLRESVAAGLRAHYGGGWLTEAIPPNTIEQWIGWASKDRRRPSVGSMVGEELIAYSSLGSLSGVVRRHWGLLGQLVGGDRRRFEVLTAELTNARDVEAHHRELPAGERALADGIVSYLREVLSTSGMSPTRTLLSRAVDQFTNPELGYGISADLLDQVWDERDALALTDRDLAVLAQSEDLNATGLASRWLREYGASPLLIGAILAHEVIRLQWAVLRIRSSVRRAGLEPVIEFIAIQHDPKEVETILKSALRITSRIVSPDQPTEDERRFRTRISAAAGVCLRIAIASRVDEMLVDCCTSPNACRKVTGYEVPPDEKGRRLIIEEITPPCHVVLSSGKRRRSTSCRLRNLAEKLEEHNGVRFSRRLPSYLTSLVRVQHALASRSSEEHGGVAYWDHDITVASRPRRHPSISHSAERSAQR